AIDARKILELFPLESHLPLAKDVLQAVVPIPEANRRLKRLVAIFRHFLVPALHGWRTGLGRETWNFLFSGGQPRFQGI
ncbi:MAG: hypothetical protein L0Y39_07075, partial [Methylococcaceae bacterium]|nr:hypothetical protein [Methylococcaceae bacterium]